MVFIDCYKRLLCKYVSRKKTILIGFISDFVFFIIPRHHCNICCSRYLYARERIEIVAQTTDVIKIHWNIFLKKCASLIDSIIKVSHNIVAIIYQSVLEIFLNSFQKITATNFQGIEWFFNLMFKTYIYIKDITDI